MGKAPISTFEQQHALRCDADVAWLLVYSIHYCKRAKAALMAAMALDSDPPLDGPGEESQLFCKPVSKKAKTTPEPATTPEPIDVDADASDGDADADASDGDGGDGDDLDRFRPRTEVDLRLGDSYASGVVVLAPEHRAWFNADVKGRLADLERAVGACPALQVPAKEGAKLPRVTVLGDELEATVSFAASPAPYLLLVADADNGGAGGYRQLAHDGYRLTCTVRPRAEHELVTM